VKPKFNVNRVAITQVVSYNMSRKGQWEGASWRPFTHSHYNPLNVTVNGIPCILFWAKRIMIKFENHTQLDLTEKTFGVHATVDVGDSNCSEDSAILSVSLHVTVAERKGKNWLECCSVISGLRTDLNYDSGWLSAHTMHCPVFLTPEKSLKLLPSPAFFVKTILCSGFRPAFKLILGFYIQEGHFAYAKDCASFFSPAILMGLVMSLILLLVLAYALHKLIHLKSFDRHYERKTSPAYFVQMKDSGMGNKKDPLRTGGNESYKLINQQFYKTYI
ncbi:VAS1L protein, partial [Uria aalge]|nr:VAS1L protein [Uria aalge]